MTDTETLQAVQSMLATTPIHWSALVQNTPADLLNRPAANGEWSAFQCLCHLLDTESMVFPVRLKAFLAGDLSFPAFDPETESTDYSQQPPEEVVQRFVQHRRDNLELLSLVQPEHLDHQAVHAELGSVTLLELLNEWIAHDFNHITQAEEALMQPFIFASGPWRPSFKSHDLSANE